MHFRRRKAISRLTYVASLVGVVLAFGFVSTAFTDWTDTLDNGDIVTVAEDVPCKFVFLHTLVIFVFLTSSLIGNFRLPLYIILFDAVS